MPYIKKDNGRREALQRGESALNAGELNYQIFYYVKHAKSWSKDGYCIKYRQMDLAIIKQLVDNFLGKKPNYQRYNDI